MIDRTARRAGLGIAVLGLLLTPASALRAAASEVRVTSLHGAVEIGRGEPPAWRAARTGDVVAPGEVVRTGRGGRAELALGSGTVRLYENSLLRLPSDASAVGDPQALGLESGSSLFDLVRRRLERALQVRTPEVVVSVKGTRFAVALEGELAAVSVYRGEVAVRDPAAAQPEVLVREGFAAVGGRDLAFELLVGTGADPWDAWSGGAAGPAAPSVLLGTLPEGPGVKQAREASRQASHRALLAHLEEQRPEAVRRALRNRKPEARADATLERMADESEPPDAPIADLAEADSDRPEPTELEVDPLSDARKHQEILEDEVVEEVIEEALNGGDPSGADGSSAGAGGVELPFAMDVVTSGGPNYVEISTKDGTLSQKLTSDDLDAILREGDLSAYGPLLDVLNQLGVDPVSFAEHLDGLI